VFICHVILEVFAKISTLQMEAVDSSETLVNPSNIIQCVNPEHHHLQIGLVICVSREVLSLCEIHSRKCFLTNE